MNDPDNFLSRWSRRKRGADTENSRSGTADAQSSDRTASPRDEPKQDAPTGETESPPAFDVASLPPIESIDAGTDISPFMKAGVPAALRHAALRRAWTADPTIREYMGPTENFWDAAGPDGIPGFGELDPGLDVKRMVSELFGETAPDKPEPEQRDPASAPALTEENFEPTDDRNQAALRAQQQGAPQQNENGATQKQSALEPPVQKKIRRHGGAMPE